MYLYRLNFIPIALEGFPKAFGIVDEEKHFFPHLFNTNANLFCPALPKLPEMSNYLYESIMVEKRERFLNWYDAERATNFSLREELPVYCISDVRLLSAGLVAYRRLFLEECGFEVLERCTTLASAVMSHFRMNILKKNTIGVASELSYEVHDKQSTIAKKFLSWYGDVNDVHVQTAEDPYGEFRLTPSILLDGFVRNGLDGESRDLAIEVNGYIITYLKNYLSNIKGCAYNNFYFVDAHGTDVLNVTET
jgi:hypothetical protein